MTILQNFEMREELYDVKLGPIKGILIGGASGTGKTTYINRLKLEINSKNIHFHEISSTQLLSRVVGGAEEYVRKTFR